VFPPFSSNNRNLFNTIISRCLVRAQRHLLKLTDASGRLVGPVICIKEKCLIQVVWMIKYIESFQSSCSEASDWWAHISENSKTTVTHNAQLALSCVWLTLKLHTLIPQLGSTYVFIPTTCTRHTSWTRMTERTRRPETSVNLSRWRRAAAQKRRF